MSLVATKNAPILRFKEFKGDWTNKNLGDLGDVVNGLTYSPENICDHGVLVLRSSNVHDGQLKFEDNVYVNSQDFNPVKENDILICVRNGSKRLIGKNCLIDKKSEGLAFGAFMTIYRSNLNKFIFQLFSHQSYFKTVHKNLGATINSINNNDLKKFNFFFPEIDEQQKIAEFLSSVDKKIQLLEKKKGRLELYKKGVMQKIFSREIRFKDDNGNSYPDWDKKRFEELLDYEQPNKYIVESTAYNDEFNTPVLTAGKTFVLGYTDELKGIFNNLPVIIFDDFTMSNKYVDFPFKVKSGAMKILKPKTSSINLRFVFELMQTINYPSGEEHKRFWISEYSKIKINWPCTEEQKKIADFLFAIDKKIETTSTQIDKTKEFKKGLLQQMFV